VSSHYVILSRAASSGNGMAPLGRRREIIEELRRFNTSPERDDVDDVLYGPGIRIEMPPGNDPVTQMLLSIMEEEIAWLVVMRLAKEQKWTIVDTESGRALSP
jgi:hypothetical protein